MEQYHPHILLFPFPAKGHIKPFLCLAELLCNAGVHVTFLNIDYYHRRIDNLHILAGRFPTLHLESISDGLPLDHSRDVMDGKIFTSMNAVSSSLFRELLLSLSLQRPVTCLITDLIFSFPMEISDELGIPVFSFCTFSARFLFLYFWIPKLLEEGQLPYPDGDMNKEIHGIPGGEGLIRNKDLPGFWSVKDVSQHDPMIFLNHTLASSRSYGLILNTFDELEAPFLKLLSTNFKKIYTVGPIHSMLNSHCGFWKEDHSCLAWLDARPSRTVVFVSFGSLVKMTSEQLREFWLGLLNSGKSFLFVLRSDVVDDDNQGKEVMKEIMEKDTEGRGMVVAWAPQEEVLAHQAVGGFLTHSGWNSTLESIVAGVPMISWPKIGDQPSNCTWVTKVWKIGLEMEDRYDSTTVETMILSLMEKEGEKIHETIVELAKRAKYSRSNRNLEILIEEIKKMKPSDQKCFTKGN